MIDEFHRHFSANRYLAAFHHFTYSCSIPKPSAAKDGLMQEGVIRSEEIAESDRPSLLLAGSANTRIIFQHHVVAKDSSLA